MASLKFGEGIIVPILGRNSEALQSHNMSEKLSWLVLRNSYHGSLFFVHLVSSKIRLYYKRYGEFLR
jgi:hypothetical protein